MSISCRILLRNTGTVFALLLSVATSASLAAAAGATESFDLVLKGGRVIDPETGLDAPRDVGIRGDTNASVGCSNYYARVA